MPYPHSFIKLTPEEKKIVSYKLSQYSQQGRYKQRRRLRVLWLSDMGLTFDQIARQTNFSFVWVRKLIYLYKKEGLTPFIRD